MIKKEIIKTLKIIAAILFIPLIFQVVFSVSDYRLYILQGMLIFSIPFIVAIRAFITWRKHKNTVVADNKTASQDRPQQSASHKNLKNLGWGVAAIGFIAIVGFSDTGTSRNGFSNVDICKAGLSFYIATPLRRIQVNSTSPLIDLSYNRETDNKYFQQSCDISGNQINLTLGYSGDWVKNTEITFSTTETTITIFEKDKYSGSKSSKTFHFTRPKGTTYKPNPQKDLPIIRKDRIIAKEQLYSESNNLYIIGYKNKSGYYDHKKYDAKHFSTEEKIIDRDNFILLSNLQDVDIVTDYEYFQVDLSRIKLKNGFYFWITSKNLSGYTSLKISQDVDKITGKLY